nr:hypothetical protein [uncultured Desulfobacter sp.]
MVTSDSSGCIVDFEIQEGKGVIRSYIVNLGKKWRDDPPRHRSWHLTVKVTEPNSSMASSMSGFLL